MTQSFDLGADWSVAVEARGAQSLVGGLMRGDVRHADLICLVGEQRALAIVRVRRGRRFSPTGGVGPFGASYTPLRPAFDSKVLNALGDLLDRELGKPTRLDIVGPGGKEDPVLIFHTPDGGLGPDQQP